MTENESKLRLLNALQKHHFARYSKNNNLKCRFFCRSETVFLHIWVNNKKISWKQFGVV